RVAGRRRRYPWRTNGRRRPRQVVREGLVRFPRPARTLPMRRYPFIALLLLLPPAAHAAEVTVSVETPMSPPAWALLRRALLRATAAACREFADRYHDERGYLRCVERWGGDDGPDDAIECCTDWPTLHALGAPDSVLRLYKKAWEGHLRQYTAAKTTRVPCAKDALYYTEYPTPCACLPPGDG